MIFGRGLWVFGGLLTLVLIAALVAGIVWTTTRNPRSSPTPAAGSGRFGDDPLRLAAARYAAGEIDRDQFERISTDLRAASAPPDPPSAS